MNKTMQHVAMELGGKGYKRQSFYHNPDARRLIKELGGLPKGSRIYKLDRKDPQYPVYSILRPLTEKENNIRNNRNCEGIAGIRKTADYLKDGRILWYTEEYESSDLADMYKLINKAGQEIGQLDWPGLWETKPREKVLEMVKRKRVSMGFKYMC